MRDFEIFRFSVYRPPQSYNSVDPDEAGPSSIEAEVISLWAQGETADEIPELLKMDAEKIKAAAQDTCLYKLAQQSLGTAGELSLIRVLKALDALREQPNPSIREESVLGAAPEDPNETPNPDSRRESGFEATHEDLPDRPGSSRGMRSEALLAAIRRVVKHPTFRQAAMKVHDAWLLLRIAGPDAKTVVHETPAETDIAETAYEGPDAETAHERPTEADITETAHEGPTEIVIMEAALRIGAVLRYIARAEAMPSTEVLDRLLKRRVRISQKVIDAARTADFKARYSAAYRDSSLIADLNRVRVLYTALRQPQADKDDKTAAIVQDALNSRIQGQNATMVQLSTLLGRLAALTELKRISLQVADMQFGPTDEHGQMPAEVLSSPGLFRRGYRFLFGTKEQLATRKHRFDRQAYVEAVQQQVKESPILKNSVAWVNTYTDKIMTGGMVGVFWKGLVEELCGVQAEIASIQPMATLLFAQAQTQSIAEITPVRVLGFMDLIRATERLIDNDAREIAHIENRAGGETRERIHTFFESNENLQTVEAEEETEETRDLQTSKRFELQNETQRTLESEFAIEASVNASADYGKFKLDTSVTAGYRNSVSESRRTAANFARQVIDRSLSSIRTRRRSIETARVLRTTEERNRHAFETHGDSKSDVYLWVERIHEVSLRNYGKRVLLEFIIPEPGASLAYQYRQSGTDGPPEEFTETATDIDETNYRELAHRYGARNVTPPPQEFLLVGAGWHEANQDGKTIAHSKSVKIPPGYIPDKVLLSVSSMHQLWNTLQYVRVSFAGIVLYSGNTIMAGLGEEIITLPTSYMNEVDSQSDGLYLSVSCRVFETRTVDLNVAVICRRSCRTYESWQIDTHDRIYTAYQTALAEYEERLAANPMGSVKGGHPVANREAERRELKRVAIAMLRGSPPQFDLYPSWTPDADPTLLLVDTAKIPQLREALDLFENSLEWEQSTYTLYPYYWGNRDRWALKAKFNVPDPTHRAFLEAGAARLIVPVVPNEERRILDFLVTQFANALLPFSDVEDPAELTAEHVYSDILDELPPPVDESADDSWETTLVQMNEDLARGVGTLSVTPGSADVTVAAENPTTFDAYLDRGRVIWINAQEYTIEAVEQDGKSFTLNRPYSGPYADQQAGYVVGARLLGAPWQVRVPTSLVVLATHKHLIRLENIMTAKPEAGGGEQDEEPASPEVAVEVDTDG